MSDYTIRAFIHVPAAMRFLTDHLDAKQIALAHRVMQPKSGGKGSDGQDLKRDLLRDFRPAPVQARSRGHRCPERHRGARRACGHAIDLERRPDDAELIICSIRLNDLRAVLVDVQFGLGRCGVG